MKKRTVAFMLSLMMTASLFAGCGSSEKKDGADVKSGAKESSKTDEAAQDSKADKYTIGISQFAEHPSLDNCREGFLAGLAEEGITEGDNLTVIYENAISDPGMADTIASSFVSQKVDLIGAIATPAAAAAYNATMETEIPVVYTAISDPVKAGLATEDGTSTGNITGTSDILPVSEQLQMIRTLLPDAKKIGILYTTSEENSLSTIETYKKLSSEYGFEIVDAGINTVSEVEMAAADLASKVDCLCNLTDNTVVQALQVVLAQANNAKIPVFGSEIEQVKSGCVASMGIDYVELGKVTGKMAAKVLKGENKASELKFETAKEAGLYVNTKAAEQVGMKLDEAYLKDAAEVFDEIVVK
ncbi:MAG: ABC transporter substrate-binding protein [Lachnospiraceae bacterium]|nr:ABC transporter substrate-binding protein [Lachnospiraceae bacterium]